MIQIFIRSIICSFVLSSGAFAADTKSPKTSADIDSIIELQQQIEALQKAIEEIDTDSEAAPTLYTYNSAVDPVDAKESLRNKLLKNRTDLMKNISTDGNIIHLGKIEEQGIYGRVGGGIDVSNAAPITTRGEVTYLGSYSGNNNIPIGMVAGSLFASTLMKQKEKLDDYSIFLGGYLGMYAQTWFGDNINRVDFSNNPISPFDGSGQNIYQTSSRLYFVSNLGSYVTAAYDVSTSELQNFFIGNAFVVFGNLTESPFFITAGRSRLPVSTFGGGGNATGSVAGFLGVGRASNISLNYKSNTINTNIAIFGTTDKKVNFSTGFFYADSWTENLSIGFNTGYVHSLNGAENSTIPRMTSKQNIGAYNIDGNISYEIGVGTLQANTGWATTTATDNFKGTGEDVFAGAWYLGINYSLNLMGRSTNFNFGYGQTYNADAIPMGITASPFQDGISETGIAKQLIFSAQRSYFDNYVLFGPEWAYQQFYDDSHMNTITLTLSVYL